MNGKGQGSMFSFFTLILGLILMVAFLPVVNSLVGAAVASNMEALSMSSVIQMLLGMTGVIMIILFFMSVISDFQSRQQYVG